MGAYFQLNFMLMQNHKYSLAEIEDMIPWEREVYIQMLIAHLKKEKDKVSNQKHLWPIHHDPKGVAWLEEGQNFQ